MHSTVLKIECSTRVKQDNNLTFLPVVRFLILSIPTFECVIRKVQSKAFVSMMMTGLIEMFIVPYDIMLSVS